MTTGSETGLDQIYFQNENTAKNRWALQLGGNWDTCSFPLNFLVILGHFYGAETRAKNDHKKSIDVYKKPRSP